MAHLVSRIQPVDPLPLSGQRVLQRATDPIGVTPASRVQVQVVAAHPPAGGAECFQLRDQTRLDHTFMDSDRFGHDFVSIVLATFTRSGMRCVLDHFDPRRRQADDELGALAGAVAVGRDTAAMKPWTTMSGPVLPRLGVLSCWDGHGVLPFLYIRSPAQPGEQVVDLPTIGGRLAFHHRARDAHRRLQRAETQPPDCSVHGATCR